MRHLRRHNDDLALGGTSRPQVDRNVLHRTHTELVATAIMDAVQPQEPVDKFVEHNGKPEPTEHFMDKWTGDDK